MIFVWSRRGFSAYGVALCEVAVTNGEVAAFLNLNETLAGNRVVGECAAFERDTRLCSADSYDGTAVFFVIFNPAIDKICFLDVADNKASSAICFSCILISLCESDSVENGLDCSVRVVE